MTRISVIAACLLASTRLVASPAPLPLATTLSDALRRQILADTHERGWRKVSVDITPLPMAEDDAARHCKTPVIRIPPSDNLLRRSAVLQCTQSASPYTVTLWARVKVSAQAVSLASDVAAGTPLTPADLAGSDTTLATLATETVMRNEDAVGFASRHRLKQGQILLKRMLDQPYTVARGNQVTVVIKEEGVEIALEGTALDNGRTGDWIRVANPKTRKQLRARVNADGTASPAPTMPDQG